jgi:hypothetical protein
MLCKTRVPCAGVLNSGCSLTTEVVTKFLVGEYGFFTNEGHSTDRWSPTSMAGLGKCRTHLAVGYDGISSLAQDNARANVTRFLDLSIGILTYL